MNNRAERDEEHGSRDGEPGVPAADVVELQPARDAAARRAHQHRAVEHLQAGEDSQERASQAVSIDIAVPTSSMSANPRTLAVATAKTRAVIAVTTLASTMVAKPFV